MNSPKVSIIIPTYNQAAYLADAIKSVLQQSYHNWEMIIVDDGSSDSTGKVVAQFNEPRIHYLYQENRGLPGARNVGIKCSTGSYLAFLDSDDIYLEKKLEAQVNYLENHIDVGLCYGHRIEIDQQNNPLWLIESPLTISISDLMLGFPFTINDFLIRKSWAEKIGGFDETYRLHGEDRDFYLRLFLEGCEFGLADQVVAYRRIYAARNVVLINERVKLMERALDQAFNDPRCPSSAWAIKDSAYSNIYLGWALQEFIQGETTEGHVFFKKALEKDRSLIDRKHNFLVSIVWFCIRISNDHPQKVLHLISQLHDSVDLGEYRNWLVFYGFLMLGVRETLWGRSDKGEAFFIEAVKTGVPLKTDIYVELTTEIIKFERIFGSSIMRPRFDTLICFIKKYWDSKLANQLIRTYWIDYAFQDFQKGNYQGVLYNSLRAVLKDPIQVNNRGLALISIKSLYRIVLRIG